MICEILGELRLSDFIPKGLELSDILTDMGQQEEISLCLLSYRSRRRLPGHDQAGKKCRTELISLYHLQKVPIKNS